MPLKNSSSEGYFVIEKKYITPSDMYNVRSQIQSLGYNILTDNEKIFFCKHSNPLLPVEQVAEHYKSVFRVEPMIYESLADFFVDNEL